VVLSAFVRQDLRRYLSTPSRRDLAYLAGLVEQGALRPVVERTFPLCETAAAFRHVEGGHARGNVVVTLAA
jgi:NADPH:quinone reductase-like Zn-dependent oxidoreductase